MGGWKWTRYKASRWQLSKAALFLEYLNVKNKQSYVAFVKVKRYNHLTEVLPNRFLHRRGIVWHSFQRHLKHFKTLQFCYQIVLNLMKVFLSNNIYGQCLNMSIWLCSVLNVFWGFSAFIFSKFNQLINWSSRTSLIFTISSPEKWLQLSCWFQSSAVSLILDICLRTFSPNGPP